MASDVVGLFEISANAENSTVNAGFRFAVKEGAVVEALEHEPLVDPVDHFASLLAGGVEAEVHEGDKTVHGNQHDSVVLR